MVMSSPQFIVHPDVPPPDRHILAAGRPEIPADGTWRVRRQAKAELRRYQQSLREYGSSCISPSALDEEGGAMLLRACGALNEVWALGVECAEHGPFREITVGYSDLGQPIIKDRFKHVPWEIARALLAVCPASGEPTPWDGRSREEVLAAIAAQVQDLNAESADLEQYLAENPPKSTAYAE